MKLIKQLIKINSISGNEGNIQKFIFQYLMKLELKPFYVGGSVVVEIKGLNNNALIFNSHTDTVPFGDKKLWKHDPFSGYTDNGKIFGLGASDEKSAISVLLKLAKYYSKIQAECDVWLTFVEKEELDGSGTKQFVKWFKKHQINKYQKVAAVLGEPTGLKYIGIAHKGNIFLKVVSLGDSGHGSKPDVINKHAVFEMMEAAEILKKLNIKWSKKYSNKLLGKPSVGLLTSITSGSIFSPNKFPDSCTATFDIRTIPEMHNISIKEIKKVLKKFKVDFMYDPVACGFTSPDEEIVKIFQKITKTKLKASESSNDMCFFTNAGMPAVVYGPGEENVIHKPNEYCKVGNIDKCFKIYKNIIKNFV